MVPSLIVMAGFCPGHPRLACCKKAKKDVDARDISAFTRVFNALCAGMTPRLWAFSA
jgi:hypothetical protein